MNHAQEFVTKVAMRELGLICESFKGQINDAYTRALLQRRCREYLTDLCEERLIRDYSVTCSEAENPPSVIEAHQIRVDIMFQPTPTISFIHLPITIGTK